MGLFDSDEVPNMIPDIYELRDESDDGRELSLIERELI